MSDNERESSAPNLGLRDLIAAKKPHSEKLARPSHWSPGVRTLSADEYDRFTDQIARKLMATCTPEHLAVIAAQHMIYSDELKCLLEENKTGLVAVDEAVRTIGKVATEVTMTTLRAWRKHLAEKRADAVRDGKKDVMARARSIATKKWHENAHQKIKIGKMAQIVYDALKETEYHKLVSSPDAVRNWIRPVAPDYASKSGR